jgi:hypothetical protein
LTSSPQNELLAQEHRLGCAFKHFRGGGRQAKPSRFVGRADYQELVILIEEPWQIVADLNGCGLQWCTTTGTAERELLPTAGFE